MRLRHIMLLFGVVATFAALGCSSSSDDDTPPPIEGFVWIKGGSFTMGSPPAEPERLTSEGPQHTVQISGFYMKEYPLTQEEYEDLMGAAANNSYFAGQNLPVETVSWYDAIVYCNTLSRIESLTPVYSISGSTNPADWGSVPTVSNDPVWDAVIANWNANGYRLPTEAEWEYACRAGTQTPFNWGTDKITTDQANFRANYPDGDPYLYNGSPSGSYQATTTAVDTFAPNAWGLYDMHGNVWEWCWDWYEDYSSAGQTNPKGPDAAGQYGAFRVVRGGSWGNGGQFLRSASRYDGDPWVRYINLGFRLVRP